MGKAQDKDKAAVALGKGKDSTAAAVADRTSAWDTRRKVDRVGRLLEAAAVGRGAVWGKEPAADTADKAAAVGSREADTEEDRDTARREAEEGMLSAEDTRDTSAQLDT